MRHGIDLLHGAIDIHVHACPHINARSTDVIDTVRDAAGAGMRAIGLMDNFANSSGYAALAMRELGHLGVEVFGGLIMEPAAGGISADCVRIALDYGYGPGTGARFISLPTHHTRNIAQMEGRSPAHIEACLAIPERGPMPDPIPEILDLVAERDVVLNTGHISGPEALRLAADARSRGVKRVLVPSSHYTADEVRGIVAAGAYVEFSFFFLSHATQVALTHVDAERHTVSSVTIGAISKLVRAAGPEHSILSSDCGVSILPPPTEGFREFLLLVESAGFTRKEIRLMSSINPGALFGITVAE